MPETCIRNFGRNVLFTPHHVRTPQTEDELRALLQHGRKLTIRAGGSRHAWSDGIATDGIFVDMWQFAQVEVSDERVDGFQLVTVGGGCPLDAFLEIIERRGLTLPTLGTIARQTVAGAISTATHGSGRSSLSHYVHAVRIAAYDASGTPEIRTWSSNDALRIVRCGLGCTGIIVSVTLRCVPRFQVAERVVMHNSLQSVMGAEDSALDEFALVPYLWQFVGYHRTVREPRIEGWQWWRAWPRRAGYRWYKVLFIDRLFHLLLTTVLAFHALGTWGSKFANAATALLFGATRSMVQPGIWFTAGRGVIDHNVHALTRKHYLFRHIEMEIFIPSHHLEEATTMLRTIVDVFAHADAAVPEAIRARLAEARLLEELVKHRGSYMHHYPLYFRRVLADDTAISMTSDAEEPYYAVGLFCYLRGKRRYYAFARFVATAMMSLYDARLHWGKYLPTFPERAVTSHDFERLYPNLPAFRRWCAGVDPGGVFQNGYTRLILGFEARHASACEKTAAPSLQVSNSVPPASSPAVTAIISEKMEST